MDKINKLWVIFIVVGLCACHTGKQASSDSNMILTPTDVMENRVVINKQSAPVIVYKTIADFNDYVPVIMNESRTEIVSYPAPSDLYYGAQPSKPLSLKDGYLLDNRGINENVVFLTYTYEEYSKMKEAPSLLEMKKNIKEKYPLKELIKCGNRQQWNPGSKELDKLIDDGFPGCERVSLY